MLLCAHYVLPIVSEPVKDGAVLVRSGKIVDIGNAGKMKHRYPDEEVKDFGLAVLLPGFVSLHTHLENAILRGVVNDLPYVAWLIAMRRKSALLDLSDWNDSAILGGLEALSSGITTIADITSTGAACTAANKLGLRGVVYRGAAAREKSRVSRAMHLAAEDVARWQDRVDESRITVGISPSALFAAHPSMFREVSEYAIQKKVPVAMHLAGTHEEFNFIKYGSSPFSVHGMDEDRGFVEIPPWLPTGTSPVRYALNWGAFEAPNVMVIHGVHVDDEDIQKMRANDVSVAICPRCNAQLGMGAAPIGKYLRAGVRIGFGTDSPAATGSGDIFDEMRLGMLIQRAMNIGEFIDSTTVLEMATMGAARALRMDDRIGSLEVGKEADIIAVDLSGSHQTPLSNPVSALVNTCNNSNVLMSMIAGKVLYEQDEWNVDVDMSRNFARVIEIRGKLRV